MHFIMWKKSFHLHMSVYYLNWLINGLLLLFHFDFLFRAEIIWWHVEVTFLKVLLHVWHLVCLIKPWCVFSQSESIRGVSFHVALRKQEDQGGAWGQPDEALQLGAGPDSTHEGQTLQHLKHFMIPFYLVSSLYMFPTLYLLFYSLWMLIKPTK